MNWQWHSAQKTHRGKFRKINEDSVLSRPNAGIFVVADGMGGHEAGNVASTLITQSLSEVKIDGTLSARVDCVEENLLMVNDQLRELALEQCEGKTIGSTVVVLLVFENVGVALWAGDSSLYRLRGQTLEQVTRDHNPVSDLLDSGTVTEAEVLATDTNIITRAVGGQLQLFLDVAVFDVNNRDTFLLCSDGLYRELGESQLVAELCRPSLEDSADRLLEKSLEGLARDNISLVVARPNVS